MKRLDLGMFALAGVALFILPKLLGSPGSTRQPIEFWADNAGNVIRTPPSFTPPPGYVRPASEYEIEQQGIIEDYDFSEYGAGAM
jgi:hypothetical protein